MTGIPLRYVISQGATLLVVSHFMKGIYYDKPKKIFKGSSFAHSTIHRVIGCDIKPILPFQHLNCKMTSTCAFDGVAKKDTLTLDAWARVSSATQSRGGAINNKSMWVNE